MAPLVLFSLLPFLNVNWPLLPSNSLAGLGPISPSQAHNEGLKTLGLNAEPANEMSQRLLRALIHKVIREALQSHCRLVSGVILLLEGYDSPSEKTEAAHKRERFAFSAVKSCCKQGSY